MKQCNKGAWVENRNNKEPRWAESCGEFEVRDKCCITCVKSRRNTLDGKACNINCHKNTPRFNRHIPLYIETHVGSGKMRAVAFYKAIPKTFKIASSKNYPKPGRVDKQLIGSIDIESKPAEVFKVKSFVGPVQSYDKPKPDLSSKSLKKVVESDGIAEIKARIASVKEQRKNFLIQMRKILAKHELIGSRYIKPDYASLVLTKKESKFASTIYLSESYFGLNSEDLTEMDKGTWTKVEGIFDKLINGLDKLHKARLCDAKEELCRLTDCYKVENGKKIRRKVALKICEKCGKENLVEGIYCCECGSKI